MIAGDHRHFDTTMKALARETIVARQKHALHVHLQNHREPHSSATMRKTCVWRIAHANLAPHALEDMETGAVRAAEEGPISGSGIRKSFALARL
jgi:hypothetical protein